ncbi:MAG: GNAT family N-acetyltransferase [Pseudonocardiaceae bacterium]
MTRHSPPADINFVDAEKLDSTALVKFHREILSPNFHPDQLVTEEVFVAGQQAERSRALLAWDDKNNLVGGLTGHYYSACRVYLLGYLAVSPNFRRGGVGSALLHYGLQRWSQELSPLLMLGEVEDPREHRDTEFGDPWRRFLFYRRFSAQVLQLPYFQPALGPSGSRVRKLLLMVFLAGPDAYTGPTTVAGRPLDCFIHEYVVESEGRLADDDVELEMLLTRCGHDDGVPLLPVGALPHPPC